MFRTKHKLNSNSFNRLRLGVRRGQINKKKLVT